MLAQAARSRPSYEEALCLFMQCASHSDDLNEISELDYRMHM